MTDDDYKELMKFHLMFTEADTSDVKYVAADAAGSLWGYPCEHPELDMFNKFRWVQNGYNKKGGNVGEDTYLHPIIIAEIEPHNNWNKIVVEL